MARARNLLDRSLTIWHKVHGTENHPDVATSLHSLAHVRHAQGDLGGARDLLERAPAIWHKILGTKNHPDVAASLHALAQVLHAQDFTGRATS